MEGTGNIWTTLIWFGAIALIFYFMLIRPQQQERKRLTAMVNDLRKGNHVITNSGIYGEIVDIKDNVILLDISDEESAKVMIRMSKYAVQSVLGKDSEDKPKNQG